MSIFKRGKSKKLLSMSFGGFCERSNQECCCSLHSLRNASMGFEEDKQTASTLKREHEVTVFRSKTKTKQTKERPKKGKRFN